MTLVIALSSAVSFGAEGQPAKQAPASPQGAPPAVEGSSPKENETLMGYLIELFRRRNTGCDGSAGLSPLPGLVYSQRLREVLENHLAKSVPLEQAFSVARPAPQKYKLLNAEGAAPFEAFARMEKEFCPDLRMPYTHVAGMPHGGKWWVLLAEFPARQTGQNGNATAAAPPGSLPATQPSSPPTGDTGASQETAHKPGPGAVPAQPPNTAEALMAGINELRAKGGHCQNEAMPPTHPLRQETRLANAASIHGADMVANNYFSVVSPTGVKLEQRVDEAGYPWRALAGIIAKDSPSASAVLSLWLSGPKQCRQIMDPQFTELGIAVTGDFWTLILAAPGGPVPAPGGTSAPASTAGERNASPAR